MSLHVRVSVNLRRSPLTSVVLILLFVLVFTSLTPQVARAATTITVDTTADDALTTHCTLRDAIDAANNDATPHGTCPLGTGGVTMINFSANGTFTLGSTLPYANVDMTITGNGVTNTVIKGGDTFRMLTIVTGTDTIQDLTMEDGSANPVTEQAGGAIYNGDTLTVIDSVFSNDQAPGGSGLAGGIFNAGVLTVTDSVFSNDGADEGGALYNGGTQMTITGSSFLNNSVTAFGGAIETTGATTISNSTFYGNHADARGSAIDDFGTVTIEYSTISGNTSGHGAIGVGAGGPTLDLGGTIVAGNTNGGTGDIVGPVNSLGYNIIGSGADATITDTTTGNQVGTNATPINPLLNAPANNGGMTETMSLQFNSPALNTGSNALATSEGITTDQRGASFPRPFAGQVDIGAYEMQQSDCPAPAPFNVTVPTGDSGLLEYYISCANNDGTTDGDTINLTSGTPYTLTVANNTAGGLGGNGLPAVSSEAFGGSLTINGNGATIQRDPTAPQFRIFILSNSNLTLNDLTISGGDTASFGGGIQDEGATLTITDSTISGNTAGNSGGGLNMISGPGGVLGSVTVSSSTFSGNMASQSGGGIVMQIAAPLTITNSTFSGNSASANGGGIGAESATITNSTFSGNSAGTNGGGIDVFSADVTINNSIIANSTHGGDCSGGGTIQNTLIMDGSCGITAGVNGNLTGDPLLGTLTGSPAYFPLLNTSPAINAGDNALAVDATSNPLITDERGAGFPRIVGGTVDLGAIEDQGTQHLAFVQQPTDSIANATIAPSVTVAVEDSGDHVLTGDNSAQITLGLANNPGGSTLGGTLIETAVDGVATFSDLSFDQPGIGYTLSASATDQTGATSDAFNVCPASPFSYNVAAGDVADLIFAINCANAQSGNDTINLASSSTYTLTTVNNSDGGTGGNGLPSIASAATSGTLTINGNDATIERDSAGGTPSFRLFYVQSGGDLTLDSLTISNGFINQSSSGGGAIVSYGGTLTISNSAISGNSVSANADIYGGGIYAFGSLTLTNSSISNNSVSVSGISGGEAGGIEFDSGTLTISNSSISNNSVSAIVASEGGFVAGGTVTVSNSTISNNSATSSSSAGNADAEIGGFYAAGTVTISNSTISGNTATNVTYAAVGGVQLNGAATVVNTTITGNSTISSNGFAGGLYAYGATVTITNSTIASNSTGGGVGGGMDESSSTVTVNNSIIANNTGGDCAALSASSFHYSLVKDGSCGVTNGVSGNIVADPDLGTLQNNGGSTDTLALMAGSPAIDAGSDTLAVDATNTTLAFDQRGTGFPRVVGAHVDIGAFEAQSIQGALLSATKTVSGKFEIGQTVTYTVTITNNGKGSQANNPGHEFTDTLPSDLTLTGADTTSGVAVTTGNTVTWDGSLAASGGSTTITITATINTGTVGDTISNQGTLNYDSDGNGTNDATALTDDPNVSGTSDPTVFTVVAPDISVTKSVTNSGPFHPADTLDYKIIINNTGGANADGVTLTDTPDANTTLVAGSVIISQGSVTTGNTAGDTSVAVNIGTLTKTIGTVAITFEATINNPLPSGTTDVNNTAMVTGSNFSSTPSNTEDTPLTTSSSLSLTKTPDVTSVAPGGTIKYTLDYQNTGNIGLDNVTLHETVPTNTTFDAADSTGTWSCTDGSAAGTDCTQNVGTLAGQESSSVTFAVKVNATVPPDTTEIDNSAQIASGQVTKTASATTPLTGLAPSISAVKTATDVNGGDLVPDDTLEYSITISNTGNTDATGVIFTDTPDANTTLTTGTVTSTQGTVTTGNTAGDTSVAVSIGTIAAGDSVTVVFDATVNNPLPAGTTSVSNQGTVTGTNFSSTPTNSASSTVTTTPGLSLTKSDGGASTVTTGKITYTLSYQNTGNIGLDNVTLTDAVPANTTFDTADSTSGWTCTPDNTAGSTCTLNVGTVTGSATGSASYVVMVAATVPFGTTEIDNSASIASGATTANGSDTTPLTTAPALAVQKSDGGINATPGETIPYVITYKNTGDIGLANVVLTETVPANTTFNAGASTTGWTCTPDNTAGSTCTYTVGELAATRTENVTFAVTVDNPLAAGVTEIDNQVSIASGTVTASGTDSTPLATTVGLSLSKTPDVTSVTTGGTITYTLDYQNTGNIGLDNVTLKETVPANTTFNAADSTSGWTCTPDNTAGSDCTQSLGTLAGQASGSQKFAVTVNATVPAGTTEINNTATVASDSVNDTATATTPLTGVAPDVSATKTATDVNGGSLVPGDTLEYKITISNSGNTDATNVILTDAIPTNTTYVASSTTLNSNPVTDVSGAMPYVGGGSIPDLAPGDTATVIFDVTVNNPLLDGTSEIDNTATVAGNGFPSTPATANSTVVTGLTITKAFGSSAINPGETTNLTFTIINPTGNPALTGLAFSDTLPNGLVFSGTPTAAQCSGTVSLSSAFTLNFSGGTLGAGSSTCTISTVVKADGTVSGSVTNHSSTVTADGGVSSTSGASASLTINAGATAIPAAFFECENLDTESGGSMTSDGGIGAVHSGDETGNIYCHIIAKDGSYVTDSAEIGVQSVLDLGVEQAVDVFGELPGGDSVVPFDRPVQICLRGVASLTGEVLFLDAADAGRTVERLTATQQGDTLCVEVTGAGTVVLVSGASGIAPMAAPATPAPSMPVTTPLNDCRVTTTNAPLNLRAEPSFSATVLAQLPYNITLTATEMVPGWYHVIYLDGQGWVSATYLSFAGECGQ